MVATSRSTSMSGGPPSVRPQRTRSPSRTPSSPTQQQGVARPRRTVSDAARRRAPEGPSSPPPASEGSPGSRSHCRGTRSRTRPAPPAPGRASDIPAIASASRQPVEPFSGLAKLRQSVAATGRAPTHARFRAASSTEARPPRRGSSLAVALGAVGGERDRPVGSGQAHHGRVAAGAADRVGPDQVVVALVDPALARDVRARRAARARRRPRSSGSGSGREVERLRGGRRDARHLVDRRLVGEQARGQVHHHLAAGPGHQVLALGDASRSAVASRSQRRQAGDHLVQPLRARRRRASAPGSPRPGSRPGLRRSRRGTRSRSMSRPRRPLAAISLAALVRPAAPRSWSATNAPAAGQLAGSSP